MSTQKSLLIEAFFVGYLKKYCFSDKIEQKYSF